MPSHLWKHISLLSANDRIGALQLFSNVSCTIECFGNHDSCLTVKAKICSTLSA